MSDLYFMNKGHFDSRAMLTFGVSAKNNANAIGYFGTGFKYAVAIILRLGGSLKVNTSLGKQFVFTAKKEKIREQEFNIVYVNDKEAGFTTRLGVNWEPWMAFRELYCNCMDEENGLVSEETSEDWPEKYETVVTVNCEEIARAFKEKENYFLDSKPLEISNLAEIHEGNNQFVFYKNVAIMPTGKDSEFTYNITKPIDLTEDRTVKFKFDVNWPIQKALQSLENRNILLKILPKKDNFENQLGFDKDWNTSQTFLDTCEELNRTELGISESARLLLRSIAAKKGDWPEIYLTETQLKMLNKAKDFLTTLHITVDDFPIKIVNGLGNFVMGRALNGTIYLSSRPFEMGTKQVASTLLEEWVHLKTGAEDFDRKMQNWLFDKILSIGEEINGEPI